MICETHAAGAVVHGTVRVCIYNGMGTLYNSAGVVYSECNALKGPKMNLREIRKGKYFILITV